MKLRKKIGLFFIFSCIVPVIIILTYISKQSNQNIHELNRKEIKKTVDLVGMVVNNEIEKGVISLEYLKASVVENKVDGYQLRKALYDLYSKSSNFRKIFFISEKQNKVQAYPTLIDGDKLKEEFWYKDSKKAKMKVSVPYIDKKTGGMFITLTKSVLVNNVLVGVVGVEIELTNFLKTEKENNSFISLLLLEKDSKKIVYPINKIISKDLIDKIIDSSIYDDMLFVKSFTDKDLGSEDYYTRNIFDTNLILVGQQNVSKVKPIYNKSKIIMYISIGIIVLLCMISILMINNTIIEPLDRIREKIRQGSMGNYGIRMFVDSNDEIGELCSEFNYLMKKIGRKMKKVNKELSSEIKLNKENVKVSTKID